MSTDDVHEQLRIVREQRDRAEAQLDRAEAQLDQARHQLDRLALAGRFTTALRNLAAGRGDSTLGALTLIADALGIDPDRIKLGLRGYGGFTLDVDPVLIRSTLDPAAAAIVAALQALQALQDEDAS